MLVSFDTEHFYRSLIEQSSGIILLLDQTGVIQYASGSVNLSLGCLAESLKGKSLFEFLHPQDAFTLQHALDTSHGPQLSNLDLLFRLQHNDGTWRTFEGSTRPMPNDSSVTSIVVYLHDVTDRRRTEETLQRSVAEMARSNAFITALSHVAERIATTTNPDQVLETLGRELEGIRLTCAVLLVNPEEMVTTLHYISIKPAILALIESQTGLALQGCRIAAARAGAEATADKAHFQPDVIPYLAGLLTHVAQEVIARAIRLAGVIPFTPIISLPLKVHQRLLGNLIVWGPGLHEGDIKTLSVFANQVANAIDKAVLLEAIQNRVQETETLREAAAVVTSALDLDQVLDRILSEVERVIPYDSAAVFFLEGIRLTISACHGIDQPESVLGKSYDIKDVLILETMRSGQPLVLADVQIQPQLQGLCHRDATRGWMGIPLMVRGSLIGLLTLESQQVAAYGPENETVAKTFANQAAIAIENARLFKQVQHLAITDSLTGLYNRRHFFELASREFERSRRYGRALSLLMWDIDHFKKVNDQFGHLVGDQVLQQVTQRCREQLREADILGRYGGEEFVALLPETSILPARQAAERLRLAIAQEPIVVGEQAVSLTISLGIAQLEDGCTGLEDMLDRADQALYMAKQEGRNTIAG